MTDRKMQLRNKLLKSIAKIRHSNYNVPGPILHENWMMKKNLHKKVSFFKLDEIYNNAISAGATGGKLLGAGGGVPSIILSLKKWAGRKLF